MKVPEMDDIDEVDPEAGPSESPEFSSHTPTVTRRGRVSLACQRCKRRKQRCDGGSPECTSCRKADVPCIYERAIRPRYPGGKTLYINALEERIAFLEARMPEYGQDHYSAGSVVQPVVPSVEVPPTPAPVQARVQTRRQSHDSLSEEDSSSLVDGVAYLSLCASGTTDTAPEPFYIGSSSGATVARMIQASIFQPPRPPAVGSTRANTPDVLRPSLTPLPASSRISLDEPLSEFPPKAQAQALFAVFFDRLHTRWPILDRKLYYQYFDKQYDQGSLPLLQRSILHLIYAISARFLQLTKKPCQVDPQRHLVAAVEPMDYILEQHNVATVQFLVLLVVHGQRSPYGAGAWSQVRYAITLCIEMGLHRKRSLATPSHNSRDIEIRRRVFWACYCLDRTTSLLLGRTFAIADRDINAEIPSDSLEFWELTAADDPPSEHPWSNVLPFIHIIKLRKIQSKIHRTVFRVDKDVFTTEPAERARLDAKVEAIRDELDIWAKTVPNPPEDSRSITWMYDPENTFHHNSRDFFYLQYHKTVLSLFTALLPTLSTADPRFISGARSAASVCSAYKRLNQQKTLSYTITALHSCFIAGLTLVYCLWRDSSLFSYHALEATRACSLCLTIFGEKWPGAVKYRDIFDALSGSLLKSIVNPRSKGQQNGPGSPSQPPQNGLQPLTIRVATSGSPSFPHVAAGGMEDVLMDTSQAFPSAPEPNDPGSAQGEGNVNHMILDAVKEAFMEVDEEAPGGWQGWRMFSEMVQPDEVLPKQEDSSRATTYGEEANVSGGSRMNMPWGNVPDGFYFADSSPQLNHGGMSSAHGGLWNLDDFSDMT